MTALRNAGWSYEKIADEMGCSAGTVWNYFNKQEGKMNEDKILVLLDDYEEKAKDQRTVEIIRDMVILEGDVAVNTLCVLLGIMGEPWKK